MENKNYYDFIKALDELRPLVDINFDNITLTELRILKNKADDILKEWDYLNEDLEKIFEQKDI